MTHYYFYKTEKFILYRVEVVEKPDYIYITCKVLEKIGPESGLSDVGDEFKTRHVHSEKEFYDLIHSYNRKSLKYIMNTIFK